MKVIYKYNIVIADEPIVAMPKGAQILSIQEQNSYFWIWALVNPDAPEESRKFKIFGTGESRIDSAFDNLRHVATVREKNRPLVWHIFEEI